MVGIPAGNPPTSKSHCVHAPPLPLGSIFPNIGKFSQKTIRDTAWYTHSHIPALRVDVDPIEIILSPPISIILPEK